MNLSGKRTCQDLAKPAQQGEACPPPRNFAVIFAQNSRCALGRPILAAAWPTRERPSLPFLHACVPHAGHIHESTKATEDFFLLFPPRMFLL